MAGTSLNIRDLLKAGRILFHGGSAVVDAPFFMTRQTGVDYMDVDEHGASPE